MHLVESTPDFPHKSFQDLAAPAALKFVSDSARLRWCNLIVNRMTKGEIVVIITLLTLLSFFLLWLSK